MLRFRPSTILATSCLLLTACTARHPANDDAGVAGDAQIDQTVVPRWEVVGHFAMPAHTATRLDDGTVLLVGGRSGFRPNRSYAGLENSRSVYRFDPKTHHLAIEDPLRRARAYHTAVLLPAGRVLVVGGGAVRWQGDDLFFDHSSELFDPAAPPGSRWRYTAGGLRGAGVGGVTLALPAGKVVHALGSVERHDVPSRQAAIELFDPLLDRWKLLGTVSPSRVFSAALVDDGAVWVFGGRPGPEDILRLDVTTGRVSTVGRLFAPREHAAAVAWPAGGALVIGGGEDAAATRSAERVDAARGVHQRIELGDAFVAPQAVALPSGRILLFGGGERAEAGTVVALIDGDGSYRRIDTLPYPRQREFTATLLDDGTVLIAGGLMPRGKSVEAVSELVRYHPVLTRP